MAPITPEEWEERYKNEFRKKYGKGTEIPEENLPWANVSNIAVLVTDETHKRFRKIGRLIYHDWKEYGVYQVRFPDGSVEQFPDDWARKSPVRTFYAIRNELGDEYDKKGACPISLIITYLSLNGTLEDLATSYQSALGIPFS